MENFPELECHICLDMLIEPISTTCGHTFCKLCLVRYLRDKLNCPLCRKPILQDPQLMSKNILIENLLKSKFKTQYEEKLRQNQLTYSNEYDSEDKLYKRNIPLVHLEEAYIVPSSNRTIIIKNLAYYDTLYYASISDRMLIILPSQDDYITKCSSLVEILSLSSIQNSGEVRIKVKGIKRIKVETISTVSTVIYSNNVSILFNYKNDSEIQVGNGKIIQDLLINSDEIKEEIINKINEVISIHKGILNATNQNIKRILEQNHGKLPTNNPIYPTTADNFDQNALETLSFYFLNIINIPKRDKDVLLESNNLYQRIQSIYNSFKKVEQFQDNPSLALNFYSIDISGLPKDQHKFTLILLIIVVIVFILYKYKIIH